MKYSNGCLLPNPSEVSPSSFKKDCGISMIHAGCTPTRGQVFMSALGPFIKLELPTGLIQGEASNCSPTLSRGPRRPAWEWDSGSRRKSAPLLGAPGPLVLSRSRRRRASGGPRGAPRAQARPFKLAKCGPLGVPRVIPGPLGREAAEGSQSSGARLRLPCEQSRRRPCPAPRSQRAAALFPPPILLGSGYAA